MLEKYYTILGITSHSSLNEVKKAFRIRAKALHPDVNKNSNAHEQFILLLEAYEYIVNLRTGRIFQSNTTSTRRYKTYQRWQDNEAERARHRAEYYSRKRYDVFEDSEYYKNLTHLNTILDHFQLFLVLGMLTVLPVYLTVTHGTTGFIIALLAIFITLPVSIDSLRSGPRINLKEFFSAIWKLIHTKSGYGTIITAVNIFILLRVGFQTMIPFNILLFLFAALITLSFLVFIFIRNESIGSSVFFAFIYIPLVLNCFFLFNYIVSKNPISETYAFTQSTEYIILENYAYKEYKGILMFADYEAMRDKRKITFTFEDGLFGLRVMKSYKFE